MKRCTKCGNEFPETEDYFYKQKKYNKDGSIFYGLSSACKSCNKKRSNEYRIEHKEQHNNYCRQYRNEHAELINKRHRKWFQENKEHAKNYLEKWMNDNKDKSVRYAEFREAHKSHNITKAEWKSCKAYFNYECAYCGLPIQEHTAYRKGKLINMDLHREHVNHNGSNEIDNCVPSCRNCNSSKHDLDFEFWYLNRNKHYSKKRHDKIKKWIEEDHKQFTED